MWSDCIPDGLPAAFDSAEVDQYVFLEQERLAEERKNEEFEKERAKLREVEQVQEFLSKAAVVAVASADDTLCATEKMISDLVDAFDDDSLRDSFIDDTEVDMNRKGNRLQGWCRYFSLSSPTMNECEREKEEYCRRIFFVVVVDGDGFQLLFPSFSLVHVPFQ